MIYLQDADVTLYQGDVLETLRQLPGQSVHMCCTSPPFYGLRDYGTGAWEGGNPGCDHIDPNGGRKDAVSLAAYDKAVGHAVGTVDARSERRHEGKGLPQFKRVCGKCGARRVDQQIGLEETPDLWVDRLVAVFREVRRVLRDDGTLWVEIGDSYNSPGSSGYAYGDLGGLAGANSEQYQATMAAGAGTKAKRNIRGLKQKDLVGAPWLLAFALRADGWYLRSEIIWSKPNPMPESVTDRPTTSHSRVFLLAKQARYFYDADAVREPNVEVWSPGGKGRTVRPGIDVNGGGQGNGLMEWNSAGRNRRSVWDIPTQPYPEAHFATWPEALVRPMILAGTSEKGVCPECGAPWQRVVESELDVGNRKSHASTAPAGYQAAGNRARVQGGNRAKDGHMAGWKHITTVAWQPTCGHQAGNEQDGYAPLTPAPATVLDPFAGSGTTSHVARKLGRRSIGIDLNPQYLELAARRLQQQSLFA